MYKTGRAVRTRREFLGLGAGLATGAVGLTAAGLGRHELPWRPRGNVGLLGTAAGVSPQTSHVDSSHHFYSRADLQPPRISTWAAGPYTFGGTAGAYVFLSASHIGPTAPGQQGLMVLEGDGRLRWFLPTAKSPFDLQCQRYKGEPVLTWWEGDVVNGYGAGEAVVANMALQEIARIGQVDGLHPDLHELNLTPEGTALVTAYHTVATNLSAVGGPVHGYVAGSVAMEVDLATSRLVHRWDSLDHIPVSDTYQKFSGGSQATPFDYFHINSISLADDGDLLVSARNTWTVYKVGRSSGVVKWRLNGKHSDFKMGTGCNFYWQHHVRQQSGQRISVFDDGAAPPEENQSRALVLRVDEKAMDCVVERAFTHPARILTPAEGSVQLTGDGGGFVGWGAQPYFCRFSAEGALLIDGRLPASVQSYRAFVGDLTTAPADQPVLVIGPNAAGGKTAYASWNGATEVKGWRVLAGADQHQLTEVAAAGWADFETAVTVNNNGPYFQVVAVDASGRSLRSSQVVKI